MFKCIILYPRGNGRSPLVTHYRYSAIPMPKIVQLTVSYNIIQAITETSTYDCTDDCTTVRLYWLTVTATLWGGLFLACCAQWLLRQDGSRISEALALFFTRYRWQASSHNHLARHRPDEEGEVQVPAHGISGKSLVSLATSCRL